MGSSVVIDAQPGVGLPVEEGRRRRGHVRCRCALGSALLSPGLSVVFEVFVHVSLVCCFMAGLGG